MERRQGQIKRERQKIDTVQWSLNDDRYPIDDEMPLKGRRLPKSERKQTYNVDLIIPFRAEGFKSVGTEMEISAFQNRFVNFYGGIKLALDDLSREGVNLNVRVHDSNYDESDLQKIYLNGQLRNSDLILGPYKKDNVKWLADRINTSETTMISPWISSTSIADDNPFYIQVKPGLIQHYKSMLYTALNQNEGAEVYLVVRDEDDSKERYFDYVSELLNLDPELPQYEILTLNTDTLTHGVMAFDTTFFKKEDCNKVFMVPYASGRDATFVYDFLRRVQVEGNECDCKVYGMYRWLDFQEQMFELLNAMPVYLTISNLVNPSNPEIRRFKKRYYLNYGAYPTEDAYEGYDVMMYAGRALKEYGNYFQFEMSDANPYTGLQTVIDVQPEIDRDENKLQYFENQFIDIITIEEYDYRRAEMK